MTIKQWKGHFAQRKTFADLLEYKIDDRLYNSSYSAPTLRAATEGNSNNSTGMSVLISEFDYKPP